MAKVRCAKCGEIFGLQQGDIQTCPSCGCRMKVNRKPQAETRPAPAPEPAPVKIDSVTAAPAEPTKNADEYDALRREYMDMMRDKLEKNNKGEDGVYLTREEYESLLKKANAAPAASEPYRPATAAFPPAADAFAQPAPTAAYEQPAPDAFAQPAPTAAYEQPAPDAFAQPAPAPDDYLGYNSGFDAAPAYEDEAPAKGKAAKIVNWVAFLVALLAGVMSALLLIFEAVKSGIPDVTITGMDLFLPGNKFALPDTIIYGLIMFAPALCAIFALVSSAMKGKISKFILFILFLLCAVASLALPFVVELLGGTAFSVELLTSSFEDLSLFGIFAVALNGLAALVMLVAGIMVPRKKKDSEDSGYDAYEGNDQL